MFSQYSFCTKHNVKRKIQSLIQQGSGYVKVFAQLPQKQNPKLNICKTDMAMHQSLVP